MSQATGRGSTPIETVVGGDPPPSNVASFTSSGATIIDRLELTSTVISALKRFGPSDPISAAAFTRAILEQSDHRKMYGHGVFASLELDETDEKRPAQVWLDEIQTLFDSGRLRALSDPTQPPVLHGRLAIIGLALLDGQLYEQLERSQAFIALVKELRPSPDNLTDILSERGRELYARVRSTSAVDIADTVPVWPDDPLKKPEEDQLGRAAFARFLSRRIAAIPPDSGAYALHIYGPWGAGKSSLLNFLRADLTNGHTEGAQWLVVEFNAWRNQRIDPPWWSLLDAVFRNTKGDLSWSNRIREYWWRLSSGRSLYIFSVVVLMWVLALALGWVQQAIILSPSLEDKPIYEVLSRVATAAGDVSKIIALIGTIWGGVIAANRSLLLGSAGAAATYQQRVRDPMNEIKKRFNTLIERLGPRRVAVFIDDLDRCQSEYVVELLEGIQTLFREAPVVYVVAADRRWLNACYMKEYEKLDSQIHESGKSLGELFLEKAFRFSTPMPGIPPPLREQFWQYLLRVTPGEKGLGWEEAHRKAQEMVSQATGEGDLNSLVVSSADLSFVEQQALREIVVEKLAAPDVLDRLEHTLKPYAELLDPNPRAMKRLVNAYSANRALAMLSRIDVERHQLVLWTILSARWPRLALFLEQRPQMTEKIGQQKPPDIDGDLKALFDDEDVVAVIQGGSLGEPLQAETVRMCMLMHA